MIHTANRLTGFYITQTLALNELRRKQIAVEN